LEEEFGTSAKLVKGSGGVFEVTVDRELLFSKRALGRFPDPGEVAARIRDR
jgi:selenoprotein W-related protein